MDSKLIKEFWEKSGGTFHGPNVETATVPLADLNKFVLAIAGYVAADLALRNNELVAAAKEFVDRCERGEIRSKHTYGRFKAALVGVSSPRKFRLLKDHEIAETVNSVTAVAKEYAGTQQLREHIAGILRPILGSEYDCDAFDLDEMSWASIKKAATESNWIPPDYYAGDWVSDVCNFLKNGEKGVDATLGAVTDAEINSVTLDALGEWPSFEAQSWACKVVKAVCDKKGFNNSLKPITLLNPLPHDEEAVVGVKSGKTVVAVDGSIAAFVELLNSVGLITVASCSGHSYRPSRISLANGKEIFIAKDYAEAQYIDSLFFTDINGQYFNAGVDIEAVLPKRVYELMDSIDAEVFTGDLLHNHDCRLAMLHFFRRWAKAAST